MNCQYPKVCVDSLKSALVAEEAGADRIELCATLSEGGLTPSQGMIEAVCKNLSIPVMVLIRPRAGDFLYSTNELQVMANDIITAKRLGAAGVVVGVLSREGTIDVNALALLMKAAGTLPVTFHRAIDMAADPVAATRVCVGLGITRILSSGGRENVLAGRDTLKQMVEACAGSPLRIMAGGGLTPDNANVVLKHSHVHELHCSARGRPTPSQMVCLRMQCHNHLLAILSNKCIFHLK